MIPKIIHYCWFGPNQLPRLQSECIASWKKYLPDYELVIWDEDSFDISSVDYVREAYRQGKYAFVSDYVRFYALEKFGGIYLDTDVEIIRSLDDLLEASAFTGFELKDRVAPGLILGAEKSNPIIREVLHFYQKLEFYVKRDGKLQTVVEIMTDILVTKGLKLDGTKQDIENMIIYPVEYFSPLSLATNRLDITDKTYSIHHYAGSWLSPKSKMKRSLYKILMSSRFFSGIYRIMRNSSIK